MSAEDQTRLMLYQPRNNYYQKYLYKSSYTAICGDSLIYEAGPGNYKIN